MNFVALQNAVIAHGFDESDRSDAKNWINFRLGWIWDLDDWSFVQGTASVTVTSGSQTVTSMPTDFSLALGLNRADARRHVVGRQHVRKVHPGEEEILIVEVGDLRVG